jgi:hypothetical protein
VSFHVQPTNFIFVGFEGNLWCGGQRHLLAGWSLRRQFQVKRRSVRCFEFEFLRIFFGFKLKAEFRRNRERNMTKWCIALWISVVCLTVPGECFI